jgi:hypothetical protein
MSPFQTRRYQQSFLTFIGCCLALFPALFLVVMSLYGLAKTRAINLKPYGLLLLGLGIWLLPLFVTVTPVSTLFGEVAQALLVFVSALSGFGGMTGLQRSSLARGLSVGGFLLMLVSSVQAVTLNESRVDGWLIHPNIWAIQVVGITLFQHSVALTRWSIVASLSCFITVILTGSRTALLSYLLGLGLFLFLLLSKKMVARLSLLALSFLLLFFFLLPSWRQRMIETVTWLLQPPLSSQNLLISSESLLDGFWQAQQVRVEQKTSTVPSEWLLTKTSPEGWSRVQQQVIFFPGRQYSLSGEFLALSNPAGFWGVGGNENESAELSVNLRGDYQVTGSLENVEVKVTKLEAGWQRLQVTFTYTGQQPLRWWLGPTPDQGDELSSLIVRALQFEEGTGGTYQATYSPSLAASNAQTRLPTFRVAWRGFSEKPLWGQGLNNFRAYYLAHPPGHNPFVTDHAHNFILQILFERGVVGFLGLVLILAALVSLAKNHFAFLAFMSSILLANLLDYTLWSAASLYLLAASTQLYRKLEKPQVLD